MNTYHEASETLISTHEILIAFVFEMNDKITVQEIVMFSEPNFTNVPPVVHFVSYHHDTFPHIPPKCVIEIVACSQLYGQTVPNNCRTTSLYPFTTVILLLLLLSFCSVRLCCQRGAEKYRYIYNRSRFYQRHLYSKSLI
jgi:hypothetical protein